MADTENLKLELEAVDKFAALEKMLASLQSIDKTLLNLNSSMAKVEKTNPFVKWSAQINIAKAALGGFKFALGGVFSLLEKGAGLGKSFIDKAIEGQTFRQGTLIQFKALFKSEDEARKQYSNLFNIANQTPGTVEGLKDTTTKLAAGGFNLDELSTLQASYADMQALKGEDTGQNLVDTFLKIKSQGKLTRKALFGDSFTALGSEKIILDIGKQLKIVGKPDDIKKKVLAMVSQGKIGSNIGIAAALNVQKEQVGENKLGEFAVKMGKESLSGALSNVEEGLQNLFRNLDPQNMPGLTDFLSKISDALKDPEIKKSFEEAIDSLIKPLMDVDKGDIQNAFRKIAEYIKSAAGTISNLISNLKTDGLFTTLIKGSEEVLVDLGLLIGKGMKIAFFDVTGQYSTQYEKRKAIRELDSESRRTEEINKENEEREQRAKEKIYNVLNGAPSPLDPNKHQGNWVMNIHVDAKGNDNPDEVAAKTSAEVKKTLNEHHKNTRRDKQQKGL